MKYDNIHYGRFLERKNRFIALVEIQGQIETVHVKNTGRCKELLLPGVEVSVQYFDIPSRKTKWDLISVKKEGLGWVNIDSQVPNKVVGEWLATGQTPFSSVDVIQPEYTYGSSRIDFFLQKHDRKIFLEVKGCTLEIDGQGFFPDAPTTRGAKHLRELMHARDDGYEAFLLYCIAMNHVKSVKPNAANDPDYAALYEEAVQSGVNVIQLQCKVTADSILAETYEVIDFARKGTKGK